MFEVFFVRTLRGAINEIKVCQNISPNSEHKLYNYANLNYCGKAKCIFLFLLTLPLKPVSMDKMTTAKPVSPEPVSVPVPYSQ